MIYSQERRRVNQVGVVATLAAIGGIMLAAVAANGNIGKPKSETPGEGGQTLTASFPWELNCRPIFCQNDFGAKIRLWFSS